MTFWPHCNQVGLSAGRNVCAWGGGGGGGTRTVNDRYFKDTSASVVLRENMLFTGRKGGGG